MNVNKFSHKSNKSNRGKTPKKTPVCAYCKEEGHWMKQGADIICPKLITKLTKEAAQREKQKRIADCKARVANIVAEEEARNVTIIHQHNNDYWNDTKYQPYFKSYITISGFIGTCC